jgi:lipopolysaccharide export system permease protein
MPSLLSLYIARRFTVTLLLMLATATTVIFLTDYVEVLRRFSDNEGFTALVGAELGAMRVPILVDMLLPFAFLFAAVLSLLGLSRKFELVVVRATGISVWGFLRAPIAVALIFGALATAVINPLAVFLKEKAENIEGQLRGRAAPEGGQWFRQQAGEGVSIVHASSAGDGGLMLFGVTIFVFDAGGAFHEKATAPQAAYDDGRWVLTDAVVVSAASARHQMPRYELPTDLTAAQVKRSFVEPEAISVWQLPGFIDAAARTGIDPDGFRVALHALLSRPLFLAAMVLIAATVSLRFRGRGGIWRLILVGAITGFLLYALTEIVNDLGGNGIVNPVLAAWLMPVVALTFGATVLLYQEDG